MSINANPNQNRLLAALPAADRERLSPHLELVALPFCEVLHDSSGKLQYVYFPTSAIVSLQYVLESGASLEISGVGNEGMLGISLFMGGNTTPSFAFVRSAGYGFRMKAQLLVKEFYCGGAMQKLLMLYMQALISQAEQTAVCNRHHSLEQRLCRWLLLTLDRGSSHELPLTHDLIASMLGVHREGIIEATEELQEAGFINHRRGRIAVLNRAGLEHRACGCYEIVKAEFDSLLGHDYELRRLTESPYPRLRSYVDSYMAA